MTDEERAELCARMDQELEDFIDGLEKKRYTDGWPEDRWEEVGPTRCSLNSIDSNIDRSNIPVDN